TPASAQQAVDERLCPSGHDTTVSFRTSAPVSFKRLLGGAVTWTQGDSRVCPTRRNAQVHSAAAPSMAIHETQVGTAQSAIWADQCSSSLRMCRSVITPKRRPEMRRYARICPILLPCTRDEVSRPPNGSRLSCGRRARRRKGVGRSPCLTRGTTLRFL